jgi:hypothetical protein
VSEAIAVESSRYEDRETLTQAARLRAPLAQAARLAETNGLGYVVFGAATVLLSLSTRLSDLVALGVGAALIFVGITARRLAPRLRAGDASAAHDLARNELVLLAAIAIYCVLMLTVVRSTSSEIDDMLSGSGYAIDVTGMSRAFYGLVLAITTLYQGGLSLHFRRKAPLAEAYVANVPEWARQAVAVLPS